MWKIKWLAAIAIFLPVVASEPALASLSRSDSAQIAIQPCVSNTDMECLESLSAIYLNGKSSKFKLIKAPEGYFLDEFGQRIENSGFVWEYAASDGTLRRIVTTETINAENYRSPVYKKPYPALWFSFLDIDSAELKSGIKFKVVIRSSWLTPQGVGLIAANASFTEEKMVGGKRFTFIGSPFLTTSLNTPEKYSQLTTSLQDETISDKDFPNMYFVIDHLSSISGGTFWGTECSEFGYSITSHNAIGAGQPYMSDNETLKFNIGAPHRLSNGDLNTGFFTTDIPIKYIDCRWPNNILTKSPRVEISVLNPDGTTQIATTTIQIINGILKVRAYGFHYSQPTIVIKPSSNPNVPLILRESALTNKVLTIKCYKQKKVKVVSGAKPKCPVGFVLKN